MTAVRFYMLSATITYLSTNLPFLCFFAIVFSFHNSITIHLPSLFFVLMNAFESICLANEFVTLFLPFSFCRISVYQLNALSMHFWLKVFPAILICGKWAVGLSLIISFANNHFPPISNVSHCYFYAFGICLF